MTRLHMWNRLRRSWYLRLLYLASLRLLHTRLLYRRWFLCRCCLRRCLLGNAQLRLWGLRSRGWFDGVFVDICHWWLNRLFLLDINIHAFRTWHLFRFWGHLRAWAWSLLDRSLALFLL